MKGGLEFLKNYGRGGSRLSCQNRGVVYRRGGGDKHCFSLIMYGFCNSNGLYSASLSFRMLIFILTPFNT